MYEVRKKDKGNLSTTLDILTKVFMAVEDLGKILLTTGKPLKEVPAVLSAFTEKECRVDVIIFPYRDLLSHAPAATSLSPSP